MSDSPPPVTEYNDSYDPNQYQYHGDGSEPAHPEGGEQQYGEGDYAEGDYAEGDYAEGEHHYQNVCLSGSFDVRDLRSDYLC